MAGPENALKHRTVLAIAVPVMISNVSTALIGVVDTGVVGRIPGPAYIGAVALGSLVFTFVFWAFGFLRMGTTGLTAQALGAGETDGLAAVLLRALLVAFAVGGALILFQWPIRETAFALVQGSDTVESLARRYFDIRIWAAPATLANYALLGWFIGLGRTGTGLVLQLVLNMTNIVLDVLFVLGFGMDARGVATGTLLAEIVAMGAGLLLAARHLGGFGRLRPSKEILAPERLRRTLGVSGDIMVRTLALISVFVWFTSQGARQGDTILAANTILLHFVSMSAYFLDGLAFAAEALVGRAVGSAHRQGLRAAARITTLWSVMTSVAIVLVLVAAGPALIDVLTVDAASRETARSFLPWAVAAPLLGVWAFQLDGIFIGATRTRDMRNAMLAATTVFLAAWWLLTPWGNHGLWAAFQVHYLARIGSLAAYYPRLVRSVPE
jgi:MATE family multidrug resistance protein